MALELAWSAVDSLQDYPHFRHLANAGELAVSLAEQAAAGSVQAIVSATEVAPQEMGPTRIQNQGPERPVQKLRWYCSVVVVGLLERPQRPAVQWKI